MNYSPDLTSVAIKMAFSLGVVLLIVWGGYRFAKNKLPINAIGGKTKFIKIVDSQYVGVKQSIAMVEIPGSILVVGIGAEKVNLLTQIDDPDILSGIKTSAQKHKASSFKDHLNRLTKPRHESAADFHNENVVS